MRFGESRHADMAGERGAQDQHRERGPRSLAEPHVEIEQRVETKLFEQQTVARLVLREVDDAGPAFDKIKAPAKRRLGIDIEEYRTFTDAYKVELLMEGDEG